MTSDVVEIVVTSGREVKIGDLGLARLANKPLHSLYSGYMLPLRLACAGPAFATGFCAGQLGAMVVGFLPRSRPQCLSCSYRYQWGTPECSNESYLYKQSQPGDGFKPL